MLLIIFILLFTKISRNAETINSEVRSYFVLEWLEV